ncbi:hypothetical protein K493DRAFT_133518, partial [Basidiobolus meristosporus CBS 931.73]
LPFPAPSGRFKVGTVELHLVDRNRTDPYAPTMQNRDLMVQLFYPTKRTKGYPLSSYMPKGTAEIYNQILELANNTIQRVKIQAYRGAPIANSNLPIVIFSPGLGVSRCLCTASVLDMASRGYLVVAIDHPYDTGIVEFPDGRLVLGVLLDPTLEQTEKAVLVRTQDASFVLDLLGTSESRRLIPGLRQKLNTHEVVMFGHSLGGAASASAMLTDTRIIGGVNLDGWFWGPVVDQGLDRPFLMISSSQVEIDPANTWPRLWSKLRAWRFELQLADSEHMTFSDWPLLIDVFNLTKASVGSINGARAMEIQQAYIAAFTESVFRHKIAKLLLGPDSRYPEISFKH